MPVKLEQYRHQVGGHCKLMKPKGSHKLYKPVTENEYQFYEQMNALSSENEACHAAMSRFKEFTPRYFGLTDISMSVPLEHCAPEEHGVPNSVTIRHIIMEDLLHGFRKPCVLDIKMGRRQRKLGATAEKIFHQERKAQSTTSHSLGFRICGCQYYDRAHDQMCSRDKYWGQRLVSEDIVPMFRSWFWSGRRVATELVSELLTKLRKLERAVSSLPQWRFWSCSLLIVYDAGASTRRSRSDSLNMKVIDFANTVKLEDEPKPDLDFLYGLRSLSAFLEVLLATEGVNLLTRSNLSPNIAQMGETNELVGGDRSGNSVINNLSSSGCKVADSSRKSHSNAFTPTRDNEPSDGLLQADLCETALLDSELEFAKVVDRGGFICSGVHHKKDCKNGPHCELESECERSHCESHQCYSATPHVVRKLSTCQEDSVIGGWGESGACSEGDSGVRDSMIMQHVASQADMLSGVVSRRSLPNFVQGAPPVERLLVTTAAFAVSTRPTANILSPKTPGDGPAPTHARRDTVMHMPANGDREEELLDKTENQELESSSSLTDQSLSQSPPVLPLGSNVRRDVAGRSSQSRSQRVADFSSQSSDSSGCSQIQSPPSLPRGGRVESNAKSGGASRAASSFAGSPKRRSSVSSSHVNGLHDHARKSALFLGSDMETDTARVL